jgi:hypothetical protein
MLNHTDNAKGPYCTDCHIIDDGSSTTIRFHDAQLVKPFRNYTDVGTDGTGMYNSSLCLSCHEQKEVHANDTQINQNKLECASCHANASNYTDVGETVFGDKQIHGIRFINDSGVYSAAWNSDAAANCTTCHQGFVAGNVLNASPSVGVIPIPQIPKPLNHSDSDSAGLLWNTTVIGFYGPWKNPDSNNLRACLYCHGNQNETNTSVDDISNIIHNETALGRANAAFEGTGNIVNGSISTTSYWCSNCHTPTLNTNRSAIELAFNRTDWEVPVANDNATRVDDPIFGNASDGTDYVEHTAFLTDGYSDAKCRECHGNLLTGNNMSEFLHNVQSGAGNPNCIGCHDVGGIAPRHVNVSIMNSTDAVHRLLNNRTGDPGNSSDPTQDFDWNNRRCWACHSNGSVTPLGVNTGMGLNKTTPYLCPDCHLQSGSQWETYFNTTDSGTNAIRAVAIVSEHFVAGDDLRASSNVKVNGTAALNSTDPIAASCVNCHNRTEMIVANFDDDVGTPATWAGYVGDGDGNIGGQFSFYHYGKNRSKLTDLQSRYNSSGCGNSSGSGSNTSCGLAVRTSMIT